MSKLILVTTDIDQSRVDYDGYVEAEAVSVHIKEGSLQEFLNDPSFRAELRKHGWEDVVELEKTKDAIKLSRMFLVSKPQKGYAHVSGSQLDLGLPASEHIRNLTTGRYIILQEIDLASLEQTYPDFVAAYHKGIETQEKQKKASEAAQKKRELQKKDKDVAKLQKKLDAAKKILEDAGLLGK